MHRRALLALLARYEARNPEEIRRVERVRELVRKHPDCFDRRCLPGHVTGSAWIVSRDRSRFLLTHHRKLGRWLQLGGHADGDPDVLAVALREAREESGLRDLEVLEAVPIDVDVHRIPARPGEPAHEHHDVRFLLAAASDRPVVVSDESNDLAWFEWKALDSGAFEEESLLRMGRKARRAVGRDPA